MVQFGPGERTLGAEATLAGKTATTTIQAQGRLGMELEKVGNDLRIKNLIPGYPAATSGLKIGQTIKSINGTPTGNLSLEDATKLTRGPVGGMVELMVMGRGLSAVRRFELQRVGDIPVQVKVNYRILDPNFGLLEPTGFDSQTLGTVITALKFFEEKKVRCIILDLRENGGGRLDAILDFAGLFVGKKTTLFLFHKTGNTDAEPYFGTQFKSCQRSVVVLINNFTRAGGECLASAFQTSGRAKLMGQTTAGATSMQTADKQPNGTFERKTVGYFFTAKDEPIFGKGIKPDVTLSDTLSDEEVLSRVIAQVQKDGYR
jgi:carboxyl-terminal processing protease